MLVERGSLREDAGLLGTVDRPFLPDYGFLRADRDGEVLRITNLMSGTSVRLPAGASASNPRLASAPQEFSPPPPFLPDLVGEPLMGGGGGYPGMGVVAPAQPACCPIWRNTDEFAQQVPASGREGRTKRPLAQRSNLSPYRSVQIPQAVSASCWVACLQGQVAYIDFGADCMASFADGVNSARLPVADILGEAIFVRSGGSVGVQRSMSPDISWRDCRRWSPAHGYTDMSVHGSSHKLLVWHFRVMQHGCSIWWDLPTAGYFLQPERDNRANSFFPESLEAMEHSLPEVLPRTLGLPAEFGSQRQGSVVAPLLATAIIVDLCDVGHLDLQGDEGAVAELGQGLVHGILGGLLDGKVGVRAV